MTPSEIKRIDFTKAAVTNWAPGDHRNTNWPVIYVLDDAKPGRKVARGASLNDVYVGESLNAAARSGPVFLGGELVAVTSNGFSSNCRYLGSYQRLDLPSVANWLAGFGI